MIKAVFVAKDDADLGVRTGDAIELEPYEDDASSYIYTAESGERFFVGGWEVEVFGGE